MSKKTHKILNHKITHKINKKIHQKLKQRLKHHQSKSITNLCQQSQESIKTLTSNEIHSSYTKYLSSLVNTFIHNHKHTLDNLFNIKQINHSKLQYQTRVLGYANPYYSNGTLDNTLKVPNFIELFKYLFTIPTFNKHFTTDEINSFQNISTKSKHQIYHYLHTNPIGNKLADIYYKEFYNPNTNLQDTLESKFPSVKFHQLLINSFTSYKILEDIEKNMTTLSIGSLDNKDLLYIFSNIKEAKGQWSSDRHYDFWALKSLGSDIIDRVLFFNEFLNTDKLPNKVIIFLTNQEKEIDEALEHKAHFRTLNVNTAVTNGQDIIIYRKQELLKSIFHELIHFHQMDFRTIPPQSENTILAYLKKTHNIAENNEYLLYECVTESLANILNNIYSSKTKNLKDFQTHFIDELIFSTFQVAKILRLCKYNSWEEFAILDNNKHTHNHAKQFKQDSCVFSYYILKLYILLNIDEYWNTILDTQLKFIPTEDNFNKLVNLFEKGRNNKELARMINALLNSKITKKKAKTQINKTLRMTCME